VAGKKIYFFHFYVVIMTNKRLNEYMNISLDDENLKIDGRVVAKVTSKASFILLRDTLLKKLPPTEAVYFALALLGESRTTDIASFTGQDKSNCLRRLAELEEAGRVVLTEDAYNNGKPGRPTRMWEIA
jgi:hypothetical protein